MFLRASQLASQFGRRLLGQKTNNLITQESAPDIENNEIGENEDSERTSLLNSTIDSTADDQQLSILISADDQFISSHVFSNPDTLYYLAEFMSFKTLANLALVNKAGLAVVKKFDENVNILAQREALAAKAQPATPDANRSAAESLPITDGSAVNTASTANTDVANTTNTDVSVLKLLFQVNQFAQLNQKNQSFCAKAANFIHKAISTSWINPYLGAIGGGVYFVYKYGNEMIAATEANYALKQLLSSNNACDDFIYEYYDDEYYTWGCVSNYTKAPEPCKSWCDQSSSLTTAENIAAWKAAGSLVATGVIVGVGCAYGKGIVAYLDKLQEPNRIKTQNAIRKNLIANKKTLVDLFKLFHRPQPEACANEELKELGIKVPAQVPSPSG